MGWAEELWGGGGGRGCEGVGSWSLAFVGAVFEDLVLRTSMFRPCMRRLSASGQHDLNTQTAPTALDPRPLSALRPLRFTENPSPFKSAFFAAADAVSFCWLLGVYGALRAPGL